jgi:serine/threonine protein kinase
MSTGDEARRPHPSDLKETVRESAADSQGLRESAYTSVATKAGGGPSSGGVASYREFAAALIDIGILDAAELERFAADSSEGVLGLSRALVKAGKLTPYQAAAVYQKKSRGLLIGDYLILDKVGQGGMGMVFKARHRKLGRLGALKILPPSFARDTAAVMRFRREFEAAGRLNHLNLVAAFEASEDRGVHFLVMDYVQGVNLDRVVSQQGPLTVPQALDYLIQAARGLEAAHEKGIIHRDIKPGNLIIDHGGTVRVLDLGLARIVDANNPFSKTTSGRLTQSGMYMGTIDYMAPEQAEDSHRVDHRADIYSLGCTLFFMLTGREPFPVGTVLKRMVAHQEHAAPSLRAIRPDVSPALETAYQRMMAKRPEDRPSSMTEVIALLQASKLSIEEDVGTVAQPPRARSQPEIKNATPLKRPVSPRVSVDSSIFARRVADENMLAGHELNLRDLVMDVRPDIGVPAEPVAGRDEHDDAPTDREKNLRDLVTETRQDATKRAKPKPPSAPDQPLKRSGPKLQDATPPAAPKPPSGAPQPLKRSWQQPQADVPPATPKPPSAAPQPLKRSGQHPAVDNPPVTPKSPTAESEPMAQVPNSESRGGLMSNGAALFAVAAAILLIVALIVFVATRRPSTVTDNDSAPAVADPDISGKP